MKMLLYLLELTDEKLGFWPWGKVECCLKKVTDVKLGFSEKNERKIKVVINITI